ncbi:MAG: DUF4405 domain-containing protein [Candidatus Aminicenantes bacterium]|jgi:hypothetical protein
MKKSDWQYLVDTLLFICMFGIALIGILMGFFLAEGPVVRESEKYFLGLHRHQWSDIHLYLSLAFICLLIFHLILAWSWIKGKAQSLFKNRWRRAISLTVLGSILVIFVFWVFTPKYPMIYENYGIRAAERAGREFSPNDFIDEEQGYLTITGNMTIAEVEQLTGIPSDTFLRKLGLSSGISKDETLGQLRKKYGFSIVEVRDAITALLQKEERAARTSSIREESDAPEETTRQTQPSIDETPAAHEEEPKITRGRLAEDQSGILITGRMTLSDIERETGISERKIANALGLPRNISLDLSLGRLRRQYGFTMQDVRDAIAALIDKK